MLYNEISNKRNIKLCLYFLNLTIIKLVLLWRYKFELYIYTTGNQLNTLVRVGWKEVEYGSSLFHNKYIDKLYVYAIGCVCYADIKKSIKFDLFSF
jgi:hypothetical protein